MDAQFGCLQAGWISSSTQQSFQSGLKPHLSITSQTHDLQERDYTTPVQIPAKDTSGKSSLNGHDYQLPQAFHINALHICTSI